MCRLPKSFFRRGSNLGKYNLLIAAFFFFGYWYEDLWCRSLLFINVNKKLDSLEWFGAFIPCDIVLSNSLRVYIPKCCPCTNERMDVVWTFCNSCYRFTIWIPFNELFNHMLSCLWSYIVELRVNLKFCNCFGLRVYFLIIGLVNFNMVLTPYPPSVSLSGISHWSMLAFLCLC